MPVSYPKEVREIAKRRGLGLVTVDVPGMNFQGPADPKLVKKLLQVVTQHFAESGKTVYVRK